MDENLFPDPEQEDQELFEHFRIHVDKGQSLLRIDKFLFNRLENVSRNRVQLAADASCVRVNDIPVKSSYRIKPGDMITIVMAKPVREIELIPQNIPLSIVFEDEDVLVVDKPAGMVVHPAYGNYSGTLVNALLWHFGHREIIRSTDEKGVRPGLVHRIDKNTSGLLVIAKNEKAITVLARQFFDHDVERSYTALVWGDLIENEGTITGHIGRNIRDRKIMQVFPEGDQGKPAVTHYSVMERFRYVTLVECRLETGRTHQIRVHFSHLRHPLFNDDSYGGEKVLKGPPFTKYKQFVENCFEMLPRQALHAKTLGFIHPITSKRLRFESPLPHDFEKMLQKWREYSALEKIS